jgi:hypothetical protein
MVVDLGGKQPGAAGGELPQSPLGMAQASDAGGEAVVDLGEGTLECFVRCPLEGSDPRAGLGFAQGADLDQVDGVLGGVTPVAGGVTVGLSQESFVVITRMVLVDTPAYRASWPMVITTLWSRT